MEKFSFAKFDRARKFLWFGVCGFALLFGVLALAIFCLSASVSVTQVDVSHYLSRHPRPVEADPGGGVALAIPASAVQGITLSQALGLAATSSARVFAVRSVGGVYPDGTCARYLVLASIHGEGHAFMVAANGVLSDAPTSSPSTFTAMPVHVPDSAGALEVLTTNPYFAHAFVRGIALYYDVTSQKWKYDVMTNLGDLSIPMLAQ